MSWQATAVSAGAGSMASADAPEISVVIPVCNEQENVGPLAQEIAAALAGR